MIVFPLLRQKKPWFPIAIRSEWATSLDFHVRKSQGRQGGQHPFHRWLKMDNGPFKNVGKNNINQHP